MVWLRSALTAGMCCGSLVGWLLTNQSNVATLLPGQELAPEKAQIQKKTYTGLLGNTSWNHEDLEVAASPSFEGPIKGITMRKNTKIFIGASSPFSFFSEVGVQWFNTKVGNDSFSALFRQVQDAWGPQLGLLDSEVEMDNPELKLDDITIYVAEYFSYCNPWLPIFALEDFLAGSTPNSPQSPAWSSAKNIVYALGARSLASKCRDSQLREGYRLTAWFYFKSACKYLPQLVFSPRVLGIAALQALLGMIVFLWETDGTMSINTIIGLVASTGAQLGFHRDGRKLGLTEEEAAIRRRIFWIAYVLDKDIALRSGRPTSIVDPDVDVPPPETPSHVVGDARMAKYLEERVKLAKIQSHICRLLYSTDGAKMSKGTLRGVVCMLKAEVDKWWQSCHWAGSNINELLTTAQEISADTNWWFSMMGLRWGYFNSLMSIYRYVPDLPL